MTRLPNSLFPAGIPLLALMLLTGCTPGNPVKADKTVISAQESKIVYQEAGKRGFRETHYRFVTDNYTTNAHVGVWTYRNAKFPHARFTYAFLSPGYHYRTEFDVENYVSKLKLGDANKIALLDSGVVFNKVGKVTYQRFKAGSHNCVALGQSWDSSTNGPYSGGAAKRLFGHYCSDEKASLDPEHFANVIGAKGEHLPDTYRDPASSTSDQNLELPLAIHWEGYAKALDGKLFATSVKSGRGRLWLSLPEGGGDCTGEWKWLSGQFGTEAEVKGTWKALCTNGLTAEGEYQGRDPTKISGRGIDRHGREVRFDTGSQAN